MKIKQALKEKNRLTKEIKELYGIAQSYNSIEVGNPRKYNVADTLKKADDLTAELVVLKAKVHRANQPVYEKIFKLSELKSQVNHIKMISTEEGKSARGYREMESVKEVELDALQKDVIVKSIEKQINALQDELDTHNATVEI